MPLTAALHAHATRHFRVLALSHPGAVSHGHLTPARVIHSTRVTPKLTLILSDVQTVSNLYIYHHFPVVEQSLHVADLGIINATTIPAPASQSTSPTLFTPGLLRLPVAPRRLSPVAPKIRPPTRDVSDIPTK